VVIGADIVSPAQGDAYTPITVKGQQLGSPAPAPQHPMSTSAAAASEASASLIDPRLSGEQKEHRYGRRGGVREASKHSELEKLGLFKVLVSASARAHNLGSHAASFSPGLQWVPDSSGHRHADVGRSMGKSGSQTSSARWLTTFPEAVAANQASRLHPEASTYGNDPEKSRDLPLPVGPRISLRVSRPMESRKRGREPPPASIDSHHSFAESSHSDNTTLVRRPKCGCCYSKRRHRDSKLNCGSCRSKRSVCVYRRCKNLDCQDAGCDYLHADQYERQERQERLIEGENWMSNMPVKRRRLESQVGRLKRQ